MSDTLRFDFEGTSVSLGTLRSRHGGFARLQIDDRPPEIVDFYGRYDQIVPLTYDNLSPGTHTLT